MRISINSDLCEQTGVCAQVCPEDVFDTVDGKVVVMNPGQCTSCWICVENCASGAIELE